MEARNGSSAKAISARELEVGAMRSGLSAVMGIKGCWHGVVDAWLAVSKNILLVVFVSVGTGSVISERRKVWCWGVAAIESNGRSAKGMSMGRSEEVVAIGSKLSVRMGT